MNEKTYLVPLVEKNVLRCFSEEDGLEPIIQKVKTLVNEFDHDMSTTVKRKKTASLAAKVSSFKIKVDGLGKELVADWKTKAKAVDANRKYIRDTLDELRDEARKPLTDWEAEQKEIEAKEKAEKEAEELAVKIESDHEIAVLLNREHDRLKEEEEKEVERVRLEREAQAKQAQEAREKRIAEDARANAEREKIEAELREKQAIEAKEKAENEAVEAEKNAKAEAEAAAIQAKENTRLAAEKARKDEIARQEAKAKEEREEIAKREANKRHVGSIRRQAKESIMALGFSEPEAKKIVLAICNNSISNVTISY